MRSDRFPLAAVAVGLGLLAACGSAREAGSGDGVVATTSILGDVAGRVLDGCARVEVLVPPGTDSHDFEPSARQVEALRGSGLVVANGLGLEEGLDDVIGSAEADGVPVLRVAPELDPLPLDEPDRHTEEGDEGGHGSASDLDPHVWMDPLRMAKAATLIAQRATAELGCDPGALSSSADQLAGELEDLHREISASIEAIPPERRLLVTDHDTLGYFAERFGFEVVGVVTEGGTSLSEPSSAAMEELARMVTERDVRAIFVGEGSPADAAEAIAAAAGGGVEVVQLYVESLGPPGSGAESYQGLLRTDAERIVEALG